MSKWGGRGAEAYQVTEVGERKAVPYSGNYVRVKIACFKLNLAEAFSGIDAGGGERRAEACPGVDAWGA